MFKRTLSLHKPQSDVQAALSRKCRIYLPRGNVTQNTFKLYKAVKIPNNINGPFFVIKGTYAEAENGTVLTYCIFPALLLTVFCCVLPLTLIYALVFTDYTRGVPYFLLIAILLNILQILGLVCAIKDIDEEFIDRLKN